MSNSENPSEQINAKQVIYDFEQMDQSKLCIPNQAGLNVMKSYLRRVTENNPLHFHIGSCPDYHHVDGKYTHTGIGGGVPLLTQTHINALPSCLSVLEKHKIPYIVEIMVADVEAEDEFFAKKFTGGDKEVFQRLCHESVISTESVLTQLRDNHIGTFKSSSFFDRFGRNSFNTVYSQYFELLTNLYEDASNPTFNARVGADVTNRMPMYKTMYEGYYEEMTSTERIKFFVSRTLRTMAQYLALGRLTAQTSAHPIIINHPTTNLGMYNERNKFLLPEDKPNMPKIPIFTLTNKIYN